MFKHSEEDFKRLDMQYFNLSVIDDESLVSEVQPPLVSIPWINELRKLEEKDELGTATDVTQTKKETRKVGRPKKKVKEKLLELIERDYSFHGSESDHDDKLIIDLNLPDISDELEFDIDEAEVIKFEDDFSTDEVHASGKRAAKGTANTNGDALFPCKTCGKIFRAAATLRTHFRNHSGELMGCEYCGRRFVTKYLLKCHLRIHTGELLTCARCGKGFTTPQLLKVHGRVHSGARPFACDQCPKTYQTSSNLAQHKEIHDKLNNHLCPHCGATFKHKRSLTGHMVIHSDKKHVCSTCGTQWARKSDLVEHMRSHTGARPYSCKTCGKRFSQYGTLKRHLSSHGEAMVSCETCHHTFKSSHTLRRHLNNKSCKK